MSYFDQFYSLQKADVRFTRLEKETKTKPKQKRRRKREESDSGEDDTYYIPRHTRSRAPSQAQVSFQLDCIEYLEEIMLEDVVVVNDTTTDILVNKRLFHKKKSKVKKMLMELCVVCLMTSAFAQCGQAADFDKLLRGCQIVRWISFFCDLYFLYMGSITLQMMFTSYCILLTCMNTLNSIVISICDEEFTVFFFEPFTGTYCGFLAWRALMDFTRDLHMRSSFLEFVHYFLCQQE